MRNPLFLLTNFLTSPPAKGLEFSVWSRSGGMREIFRSRLSHDPWLAGHHAKVLAPYTVYLSLVVSFIGLPWTEECATATAAPKCCKMSFRFFQYYKCMLEYPIYHLELDKYPHFSPPWGPQTWTDPMPSRASRVSNGRFFRPFGAGSIGDRRGRKQSTTGGNWVPWLPWRMGWILGPPLLYCKSGYLTVRHGIDDPWK